MPLLLRIAYDGRRYYGWQVQRDVPTVEMEVRRALRELRVDDRIKAMSRTDRGAHAVFQVILVRCETPHIAEILNDVLPKDVRVVAWARVPWLDSPRRHVAWKEYLYVAPDFGEDRSLLTWACEYISSQEHEYRALVKRPEGKRTRMRVIASVEFREDLQFFRFTGHFLRQQVRRLVTLIKALGLGKICAEQFKDVLRGNPPPSGVGPAPAESLVLWNAHIPNVTWHNIIDERKVREWILSVAMERARSTRDSWVWPSK